MAEKSAAAVLVEPRKFEIREFDLPEIPPDGGLLRVERCGICGSDVHGYDRMGEGVRIMGHENLGWVAQDRGGGLQALGREGRRPRGP